jgi:hypothetical protein
VFARALGGFAQGELVGFYHRKPGVPGERQNGSEGVKGNVHVSGL